MDGSSGPLFPITGLIVATPLAIAATRFAFAGDEVLSSPEVAKVVGTSNPAVARVVCIVAAPIAWLLVAFCIFTTVNRYVLGH
jgi:hypothetical protein